MDGRNEENHCNNIMQLPSCVSANGIQLDVNDDKMIKGTLCCQSPDTMSLLPATAKRLPCNTQTDIPSAKTSAFVTMRPQIC